MSTFFRGCAFSNDSGRPCIEPAKSQKLGIQRGCVANDKNRSTKAASNRVILGRNFMLRDLRSWNLLKSSPVDIHLLQRSAVGGFWGTIDIPADLFQSVSGY